MARQHQGHPNCMEAELSIAGLCVPGFPATEHVTGYAVTFEWETRIDFVEFEDATGTRIALRADERNPILRAIYSALMKEAHDPIISASLADALWAHRQDTKEAAQSGAAEFRAGA